MSRRWSVASTTAFVLAAFVGWLSADPRTPAPSSAPAPESEMQVPAQLRARLDLVLTQAAKDDPRIAAAPAWQAEQLPAADAPDRAARLRELAEEGNAYAAFEYARVLEDCQFHTPGQAHDVLVRDATDRALMQADIQRQFVSQLEEQLDTELPHEPVDEVELAESFVARALERDTLCAGTKPAMAQAEWPTWFEQAAALGHPDAQVGYVDKLLLRGWAHPAEAARRKVLAQQFLSAALARGDMRALQAWANIHRIGLLHEPDPLLASAFREAALREAGWLQRAAMSALGARFDDALTPAQRRMARALGREIHRRCCTGARP